MKTFWLIFFDLARINVTFDYYFSVTKSLLISFSVLSNFSFRLPRNSRKKFWRCKVDFNLSTLLSRFQFIRGDFRVSCNPIDSQGVGKTTLQLSRSGCFLLTQHLWLECIYFLHSISQSQRCLQKLVKNLKME